MEKGVRQKQKTRCKAVREERNVLSMTVTVRWPKVRRALPTKDPIRQRLRHSNPTKVESSYQPSRHNRSHHNRSHHSRSSRVEDRKIKVDKDVQDLKEKYNKITFFIKNGKGQSTAEHLMLKTTLPFTDWAMKFPLPHKFKDPRVDKYDGRGDPSDHVEGFRAHLALHGTPDEIACRAFPLTLKRVVKEWFGNLQPQSIDNFDMLERQFLNQFLAVRRRKENPAYLLSLVQGKEESLKDYMQRFNQKKLTIKSLDKLTILSVLMNGIKMEGPLMAELAQRSTMGTF